MGFSQDKKRALNRLEASKNVKDVDEEAMPVLDAINSIDGFYTTSSCLGRATILEGSGKKHEMRILGKWHQKPAFEQLIRAFKPISGIARLKYEGPILHVMAKDIGLAQSMLGIFLDCGFKRSGIKSIRPQRLALEAVSTESLDAPIAIDGRPLADEKYIRSLLPILHMRFDASRKKTESLLEALEKHPFKRL